MLIKKKELYIRNFVFGVEDSLVSTVGLLAGIAVTGMPLASIIVTGVVLVFVEAVSMAAGSFLAESSAEEYALQKDISFRESARGSFIMFCSYFTAGFIPLAPYVLSLGNPFWASIAASLAALFLLGWIGGSFAKTHPFKRGVRMLVVGGLAILVGVLAGNLGEWLS